MDQSDPRAALDALIREKGGDYASLSRMIGRNPAYIQQFIHRGTPRKLDEEDRRLLAGFFGVAESVLGGRGDAVPPRAVRAEKARRHPAADLVLIPRLAIGASAGAGALSGDERVHSRLGFHPHYLRDLAAGDPANFSIISVEGDSMAPTLSDGDEIMIDSGDAAARLRDGIYVLRLEDALMVKRIALNPAGRTLTVQSDNPAYPSWPDCRPGDVGIIGRVVWVGRRLG
ncbi:S24 family peptidase [Sphingobium boeckii]|uniref:Peptidase S24/S26A/S26B/S26C domain-containing protein n=1 Tax=Sphingobium boeckii TaxID=1082345 RepID=A0A7W9AIB1_9SPHN|nr:LexA family transcriptional regulator [Sphingobium boeckii]MBB5686022.1 hypothetical protein [Sphingobium boeckii]